MFKYGNCNPAFSNTKSPSMSGFLKKPFKVKLPEAIPLILDKTFSPKGLKASSWNSSKLTATSILGLVSVKSKEPNAEILFTSSLSKEKLTSYFL